MPPVAERKPAPNYRPEKADSDATAGKQSFDPYNSGAFDFRHTWHKVNPKK
jgi:hypothetical protein